MTQLPEGRYGARAPRRQRPALRWTLIVATLLLLLAGSIYSYNNLGNAPISGQQVAFEVLDDHSVKIEFEVQRRDPGRPGDCVVRARAEDGTEVGRKEVLVRPSEGTSIEETVLRTSSRATIGEVYGCTYNVPEYLSTHTRPTG